MKNETMAGPGLAAWVTLLLCIFLPQAYVAIQLSTLAAQMWSVNRATAVIQRKVTEREIMEADSQRQRRLQQEETLKLVAQETMKQVTQQQLQQQQQQQQQLQRLESQIQPVRVEPCVCKPCDCDNNVKAGDQSKLDSGKMLDLANCEPEKVGGRAIDSYGAWTLCINAVPAGSVIYSFGIGGDVSFDDAMVEKGMRVFGFDPTISLARVQGLFKGNQKRPAMPSAFVFTQVGLSSTDGVVEFHHSKNPKVGSLTSLPLETLSNPSYEEGITMRAPVLRLRTIMASKEHSWVEVLKIDVEGVEFQLAEDFESMPIIPANQVLIEFHDRMVKDGVAKRQRLVSVLASKGFELRWSNSNNEEVLFVRTGQKT